MGQGARHSCATVLAVPVTCPLWRQHILPNKHVRTAGDSSDQAPFAFKLLMMTVMRSIFEDKNAQVLVC